MKDSIFVFVAAIVGICLFRFIGKKFQTIKKITKQIDETYYMVSKNLQNWNRYANERSFFRKYEFDNSWTEENMVICHALGEIDGVLFTECKEAFEKHYNEGMRVFELDFSLTEDGVPVVVHDWDNFNRGITSNVSFSGGSITDENILTYEKFKEHRILGKYTTLTLERFVKLAKEYEDAKFIISVKSVNQQYDDSVRKIFKELFRVTDEICPAIRKRYILHAYSFDFLHCTMSEFTFDSAIYRCVSYIHPVVLCEELKKCGVGVITVMMQSLYTRKEYIEIFHRNGIKVIVCLVTKNKKDKRIKVWNQNKADMLMIPFGRN